MAVFQFTVSLSKGSATATVATKIVATAAATRIATATAIAAAGDQKKYDDEEPNYVVIIEKIAKTIHKYPPFAAHSGDILKK